MLKVFKPPFFPEASDLDGKVSIFLAGSIEQGKAKNWQETLTNSLAQENIVVFNPRRDNWNPDPRQAADEPEFREQVLWELDALDKADVIVMFLQPGTMSPISLLELGLYANSGKLIVCCPEGFWRKGNVDIFCERYGIPIVTEEELSSLGIDEYSCTSIFLTYKPSKQL